jgi:hypothetical protein
LNKNRILEQQRIAREQAEAKKNRRSKKVEKENKLKALLTKKFNWRDFQKILQENGISGFYHFTDRSNLNLLKKMEAYIHGIIATKQYRNPNAWWYRFTPKI